MHCHYFSIERWTCIIQLNCILIKSNCLLPFYLDHNKDNSKAYLYEEGSETEQPNEANLDNKEISSSQTDEITPQSEMVLTNKEIDPKELAESYVDNDQSSLKTTASEIK